MIGSSLGAIHFTTAIVALAFGAIVLGAPKGTPLHRTIGAGYVPPMAILNPPPLPIYPSPRHLEPSHALALFRLATLLRRLVPPLPPRPRCLPPPYPRLARP